MVTETTGITRIETRKEYYADPTDLLTFGREKTRISVLTPDVAADKNFSSRQEFTYKATGAKLLQTETLSGYDGLVATRSVLRHACLRHTLAETDSQGVTVAYTYDRLGCPLTTVAPRTAYENVSTWTYTIEETSPVTIATDASGNQVKICLDGSGRETSRQRFDNDETQKWYEVSTRNYNVLGEVASGTGNDWLTSSSERYCIDMEAAYDGWGTAHTQNFSDGTQSLQDTDPVALTRTVYMQGQMDAECLVSGKVTTNYDTKSQLSVTEVRADTSGNTDGVRHYEWDGLGRMRTETDERGNKTTRTYDAYGRLLKQVLPDGSTVDRTYAPHLTGDQVISISVTAPDADGQPHIWLLGTQSFDSLGRVKERVTGGRTITYTYEGACPVPSTVTQPSGKKLQYTYIPELGNLVSSLTADGVTQTFSYDPRTDDLLSAQEGDTENINEWFPSGNLKTETFRLDETSRKTHWTHTLAGEAVSYTDIAGKKTEYKRDEHGRVKFIADEALTVGLDYDALGRLHVQAVTNSATQAILTTTLKYDDFGREITRTVTDSSGVTLIITLSWLQNGLLESRTTEQNDLKIRKEQYDYDSRNRLKTYTVTGSSLPRDAYGFEMTAQTYQYDAQQPDYCYHHAGRRQR
ncbi:hypothetical protein XS74_25070 [Salmonella enterica subsp. enterica]|nr:hypothetical protein [Salmonella enterica subsp. enterica]EDT7315915.1 RHS repeat protein [Salmonella enterica subsp. enterica]